MATLLKPVTRMSQRGSSGCGATGRASVLSVTSRMASSHSSSPPSTPCDARELDRTSMRHPSPVQWPPPSLSPDNSVCRASRLADCRRLHSRSLASHSTLCRLSLSSCASRKPSSHRLTMATLVCVLPVPGVRPLRRGRPRRPRSPPAPAPSAQTAAVASSRSAGRRATAAAQGSCGRASKSCGRAPPTSDASQRRMAPRRHALAAPGWDPTSGLPCETPPRSDRAR
eukprot:6691654-Prymnesium_polylepis.4